MSQYFSQRNTNARQHNFYGNGVRVAVEGPPGPSGPPGPAGPRGRDGSVGDSGVDATARKFIILTGWRDSVDNIGVLAHHLQNWDASNANMTSLGFGEEPFVWCYSNYTDMEHRLYASWTTANGPHTGGAIPQWDTNYPYQHNVWDRYLGFRVKPGLWKCSAYLGNSQQRVRWFLDKDRNRVNTAWNGATEYRSALEPGLGFDHAIVTVPPGGDMMIGLEQNNHSSTTQYGKPIIILECLHEFSSTDSPAVAYPGYSTAWAPKWRQIAFPSPPRLTICN